MSIKTIAYINEMLAKKYEIPVADITMEMLYDFLLNRVIYSENAGRRRWWDDWFYVADVDSLLVGFMGARANRDESIFDLGWWFDVNTIVEVESFEKTVIAYRKKEMYHATYPAN
jgi:hypothetical protein